MIAATVALSLTSLVDSFPHNVAFHRPTMTRLQMTATRNVSDEVTNIDTWVSEAFERQDPAVIGPGRCLIYDTSLRGEQ